MYECRNLDYILDCELSHGLALIIEIVKSKNERDLFNLYYFTQANGFNQNYPTFSEFKASLSQPSVERSAEEIMSEVEDIMDMF